MLDAFAFWVINNGIPYTEGKHVRGFKQEYDSELKTALLCLAITHLL